jgi:outer membrane lipoprotein-sorting protein
MRYLRTISTGRLLAGLAGLVIAILAGTAIAIAAVGAGPVPPRKPLATAIHDALKAPSVTGISARVTFTNHLIDSTAIQGSDPLLTGGSGRLWLSPGRGLRLELQSDNGDAQLVVNRGSFWAYDPASNTVYEGRLPAGLFGHSATRHGASDTGLPTVAQIQSVLTRVATHVSVSRAIPGDVARRPTYTVRVSPKTGGGLLGGVELAWDAVRGVPLRFAVYARGDSTPVLELKATDISYGAVSASVFSITPPTSAHVVRIDLPLGLGQAAGARAKMLRSGLRSHRSEVTGVPAVSAQLSFPLDAPARLAGLGRSAVRLLGSGSQAGALVVYGQGLGGIYVIERPAAAVNKAPRVGGASGDQPGLHLPGVSVNGVPAQELPTALGTVLQFTRGGVSYTVLGSVSRATAEQAARGL